MPSTVPNQAKLQGAAKGLPSHGLIAVTWSGFALASAFVALRVYARISENRRLFTDDFWILAALGFLLVNAVLQTLQANSLYYLVFASAGRVPAGETLLAQGNLYVRYEFVVIALFWTVCWCVKASFLSLYWRLFDGLPTYRKMWWAVVLFAAGSYVGCWIASAWTCHPPSIYFDFGQCTKPIDTEGSKISISYSTAVDILTDIMIMLLPLRLIPTLQVNRRQKIGLAGVFCVGIMVIAAAIARLTQIIGQARTDPVGLAVWGIVESSVSVIVGSLPALKSLLSRTMERTLRQGHTPYAPGSSSRRGGHSSREKRSNTLESHGTGTGSIPLKDTYNPTPSHLSSTSSKGQIFVRQDYGWVRSSESKAGPYDDEVTFFDFGFPNQRRP